MIRRLGLTGCLLASLLAALPAASQPSSGTYAAACRIVDGRPYTAKNQLVTRGILPQEAYERIKDQIIAHRPKK